MDPAGLAASSVDPSLVVPLGLAVGIYVRGWSHLHRRAPRRFGVERLVAFLVGIGVVAAAVVSPLHALGGVLLQAHMLQHLGLMMAGPPLIWLGTPLLPMLHGLPRHVARRWIGPWLASAPVRAAGRVLAQPLVAWLAFVASTVAWHTPGLYERALASETWHHAQHVCFLATGLLFWWPVISPWPARPVASGWVMVVYLLFADLQNTVLAAWLTFSERVVYPTYETIARPWPISALADQAAAGVIMWVPGSVAFLIPAAWLVTRMLGGESPGDREMARASDSGDRLRSRNAGIPDRGGQP
jgi:putative membrane protein